MRQQFGNPEVTRVRKCGSLRNEKFGNVDAKSSQFNRSFFSSPKWYSSVKKIHFLKEFTTTVVSCESVKLDTVINGKKEKIDGYEVILEDTILFPEGGGQPCDHGYLNDLPVKFVARKEDKALHYVEKPLATGSAVKQIVNWQRRFDHMQQHSGQHLISATLDTEFQFPTVSWWLGEDVSYIELDTPSFTGEQIKKVEEIVNELIRQGKSVKARSRGLPADHKGDIRIIDIEGVDNNMCCGTHVTNLSQLQVIKLLHTEKSKRKDKILLYFLVGNRVINRLNTCIEREQKLTALLKYVEMVHQNTLIWWISFRKNVRNLTKNLQTVLKDLAILEVGRLKGIDSPPKYFFLHKKEAEPDFMNVFIKELGRTDIFLFLSTGDEKATGNIVLYGEEKAILDLGNKICEILEGKGAGKGNKFQAKVTKNGEPQKAEDCIINYFN
ncbi:hypothetical protein NQ318_021993 [Aromia moschata]|uniref:Threonyl/alanyl tRNA synthetase SAD domain-containing protein n=1 Tax=Aromia moschata TaxID=1265417 RepID=A0AAV8Z757_9CUCU|nr:hypothetical protein NQ318_021993 [Aromia moschata]